MYVRKVPNNTQSPNEKQDDFGSRGPRIKYRGLSFVHAAKVTLSKILPRKRLYNNNSTKQALRRSERKMALERDAEKGVRGE